MGFDPNQPHLFTLDLPKPSTSSSNILTDQHQQMLLVMVEMGMDKSAIAALLQVGNIALSKDQYRFLCGPIVQHESSWRDTTPPWLFEAVTAERLMILFEEYEDGKKEGWRVGHAELTSVMYPRTMDAPMHHEHAQIYLWASINASAKKYGWSIKEGWKNLGMVDYPVRDEDVVKPSGRYYYDYQRICSDIRRKVVNAQTAREREQRKNK